MGGDQRLSVARQREPRHALDRPRVEILELPPGARVPDPDLRDAVLIGLVSLWVSYSPRPPAAGNDLSAGGERQVHQPSAMGVANDGRARFAVKAPNIDRIVFGIPRGSTKRQRLAVRGESQRRVEDRPCVMFETSASRGRSRHPRFGRGDPGRWPWRMSGRRGRTRSPHALLMGLETGRVPCPS